MINQIWKHFQRPECGWDPVPEEYAERYAKREFSALDIALVDEVAAWAGGLNGKTLLDLGGGPGQYAIEFARRGARVHWHDISENYLKVYQREAGIGKLTTASTLGYMDDATGEYDVVFNRVCWYYCVSDGAFARKVVSLVRPGGAGYLIINTDRYLENAWQRMPPLQRLKQKLFYALNDRFSLKVGHIMPSHRKIERLFRAMPLQSLETGYRGEMTMVRFRR
ncbi:MAG: methyltransferase domain-containing protein [Opitutaceae bacterium]|nr:methyltransferase domain-containing protein [Opitutaceae bacterium]